MVSVSTHCIENPLPWPHHITTEICVWKKIHYQKRVRQPAGSSLRTCLMTPRAPPRPRVDSWKSVFANTTTLWTQPQQILERTHIPHTICPTHQRSCWISCLQGISHHMHTTPAELGAMLFYLCEKTDVFLALPLSPDKSVAYQTFTVYFTVNHNTSIKSLTSKVSWEA